MQFTDTTNYNLGNSRQAQQSVFGNYSRRDMSDYTQAAYNYLMHQQDNALQIALMNYQNRYNSPTNQMLLKQAAGLSPYSDGQSLAASPSVNAPQRFQSSGTMSKSIQAANSTINNLMSALHTGKEIFDYAKYGKSTSAFNMMHAQQRAYQSSIESEWQRYLLEGYNPGLESGSRKELIHNGPRAQMFKSQYDLNQLRYRQLEAIIKMIPDQQARTRALEELERYKLQMMKGQNDAILNIHTGNDTLDSVLKAVSFYMINNF